VRTPIDRYSHNGAVIARHYAISVHHRCRADVALVAAATFRSY